METTGHNCRESDRLLSGSGGTQGVAEGWGKTEVRLECAFFEPVDAVRREAGHRTKRYRLLFDLGHQRIDVVLKSNIGSNIASDYERPSNQRGCNKLVG